MLFLLPFVLSLSVSPITALVIPSNPNLLDNGAILLKNKDLVCKRDENATSHDLTLSTTTTEGQWTPASPAPTATFITTSGIAITLSLSIPRVETSSTSSPTFTTPSTSDGRSTFSPSTISVQQPSIISPISTLETSTTEETASILSLPSSSTTEKSGNSGNEPTSILSSFTITVTVEPFPFSSSTTYSAHHSETSSSSFHTASEPTNPVSHTDASSTQNSHSYSFPTSVSSPTVEPSSLKSTSYTSSPDAKASHSTDGTTSATAGSSYVVISTSSGSGHVPLTTLSIPSLTSSQSQTFDTSSAPSPSSVVTSATRSLLPPFNNNSSLPSQISNSNSATRSSLSTPPASTTRFQSSVSSFSTNSQLASLLTASELQFSTLSLSNPSSRLQSDADAPTSTIFFSSGGAPRSTPTLPPTLPSAIVAVPRLDPSPSNIGGMTLISLLFQPELGYQFMLQSQETQAQVWNYAPIMVSTALGINSGEVKSLYMTPYAPVGYDGNPSSLMTIYNAYIPTDYVSELSRQLSDRNSPFYTEQTIGISNQIANFTVPNFPVTFTADPYLSTSGSGDDGSSPESNSAEIKKRRNIIIGICSVVGGIAILVLAWSVRDIYKTRQLRRNGNVNYGALSGDGDGDGGEMEERERETSVIDISPRVGRRDSWYYANDSLRTFYEDEDEDGGRRRYERVRVPGPNEVGVGDKDTLMDSRGGGGGVNGRRHPAGSTRLKFKSSQPAL